MKACPVEESLRTVRSRSTKIEAPSVLLLSPNACGAEFVKRTELIRILHPFQENSETLVHQVRDWFSGAAAYFGWMREAKRENTRCGLRPMSDKAASQKTRSPEGCDENGPAAALLLSHVSIQICSFVAPRRRPTLIATPLNQSRTWCTSPLMAS